MPDRCPNDGGFIGASGCTHPNHQHSELVQGIIDGVESPRMLSVEEAEAALKEGFFVEGPKKRVGFGKNLLEHVEKHDEEDAKGRKMRLAYAVSTVVNPDKVEENHRGIEGRTAYTKAFDGFGVLAVSGVESDDVDDMFTIIPKRGLRKRSATRDASGTGDATSGTGGN